MAGSMRVTMDEAEQIVEAAYPLDRHFRDIHTLNQHVVVSQKTYQSAGRMFLGLEPGEPFF